MRRTFHPRQKHFMDSCITPTHMPCVNLTCVTADSVSEREMYIKIQINSKLFINGKEYEFAHSGERINLSKLSPYRTSGLIGCCLASPNLVCFALFSS